VFFSGCLNNDHLLSAIPCSFCFVPSGEGQHGLDEEDSASFRRRQNFENFILYGRGAKEGFHYSIDTPICLRTIENSAEPWWS